MIPIAYNLGSLGVRRRTTATAVLGIALVVFVLAGALMLTAGIRRTLGSTGRADGALVIRKGSDAELSSNIDLATVGLILEGPEVRRSEKGAALGCGEVIVVTALEKIGTDGGVSNVNVRGVADNVWQVRPEAHIVDGVPARAGTDEAVIGARIRGRFKGVQLGQSVELRKGRPARIVGVFEAGGSSFESEIWADVDTVRTAFGREGLVSSTTVQLLSPESFDAFRARIEHDKNLGLEAMRESIYYEKQSENLAKFIGVLGVMISAFFSIGAMIGAMITMYASVSNREREVGTLRALGFSRRSVLASFMLEACLVSLLGGAVGCVASLALGVVKFSMINFATWSEIVFVFEPTAQILAIAMVSAVGMGVIGGFLPAIRAARLRPVDAMRGE